MSSLARGAVLVLCVLLSSGLSVPCSILFSYGDGGGWSRDGPKMGVPGTMLSWGVAAVNAALFYQIDLLYHGRAGDIGPSVVLSGLVVMAALVTLGGIAFRRWHGEVETP